ncbi:flagellar hook protein FlgE [Limoniibacter endophyticus]|uniref:Flagellar hook protein FlgE n=1 Tax=Limoniibacter endophyticus TaxID=1565040 RepID=A0A8J3DFJ5_9HYPH|nr:flagellar hook protein FlgE [Limoniibacter endophyticus]GHC64491.1 flagellar hook protein FlgE [Limoniibacter endophyticus]
MSLYGMMRTGVSGMNAQANRLSTVADNIANSSTTGYKRASTEFSTLLMPRAGGDYTSGGVNTTVRTSIAQQGDLRFTSQTTDLAVNGDGFFVVSDAAGQQKFLTRAGSFVPDSEGRLVNAAGYYLMGVVPGTGIASSLDDFTQVKISTDGMEATASTKGKLSFNLPSNAVAGDTHSTSMTTYDSYGNEVKVAVEFTKTAGVDEWTMTATPEGGAAVTQTLTFDPTTHRIADGATIEFDVPGGNLVAIDLSGSTTLAADFQVQNLSTDGNAPSAIESIEIGKDGTIYANYASGAFKAIYQIQLATVNSPDQLSVQSGNVFTQGTDSGEYRFGIPGDGAFGQIQSGALENSNVDIAEELTNMIESQRSYTANSKVFQTGSDLMDVLVNLKR